MPDNIILVADEDRSIRQKVSRALRARGYTVRTTSNAARLWKWMVNGEGRLVITDVLMPDANELELIPRIQTIRPDLKVIAMCAQNTSSTAVLINERGDFEIISKPFNLNELISVVEQALDDNDTAAMSSHFQDTGEDFQLSDCANSTQDIFQIMARSMTTNLTVLLTGELGTGKKLVARALHDFGSRKNGPFITINMAAIPKQLIESELFGHERGAFSGAIAKNTGRFEQASGGTLFIDQIGDMPMKTQTRLLRVLQEGKFTTLDGQNTVTTDARIIAASHQNINSLVLEGKFLEDLYYCLNVVAIKLPALRQRFEDIPELVRYFQKQTIGEGFSEKVLDQQAMEKLKNYHWPGNILELENLVRRLSVLYSQNIIDGDAIERELPDLISGTDGSRKLPEHGGLSLIVERQLSTYFVAHKEGLPPTGLYGRILQEVEKPLIKLTLEKTNGNQIRAAEVLGLNRNTLRKKIRIHDIQINRKKYREN